MIKYNNTKIEGNENIINQDIYNSTINIQVTQFHSNSRQKALHLFIFSLSQTRLSEITDFPEMKIIENRYGSTNEDWLPYKNEDNISTLLEVFEEKTGYKLITYFYDSNIVLTKENENLLRTYRNDSVLIIDIMSTYFEGNKSFIKIFDDYEIGGCILPICKGLPLEVYGKLVELRKSILPHLSNYMDEFATYVGRIDASFHVDLHTFDKHRFFRTLKYIAKNHLKLNSNINDSSMDIFDNFNSQNIRK